MRSPSIGLFLALCSCASGPRAGGAADWQLVGNPVDLVVPDAAHDALYARTKGRLVRFGPAPVAGERLIDLGAVATTPKDAEAFVTYAGGVRARTESGRWEGWSAGPGRGLEPRPSALAMELPVWSVVDGVLVETPRLGPGHGIPRPVALLDASPAVAAGSVAAARGPLAFVASSSAFLALLNAEAPSPVARVFGKAQPIAPAVSSDGSFGAVSMGITPIAPRPGAAPVPLETLGLLEGVKPVASLPLRQKPSSIHFADGALFVHYADGTLWRRRVELPHPASAALTPRERQVLRHRDATLAQFKLALESGELVRAADLWESLQDDGLLDTVPPAARALRDTLSARARPGLVRALAEAKRNGDQELALVLERRARMLDGEGADGAMLRMPVIQLAIRRDADSPVTEAAIDELFTRRPDLERAELCRPAAERASSAVCLELTFRTPKPSPGEVHEAARAWFVARGACPADSPVRLVGEPPRAEFACEAAPGVHEAREAFVQAVRAFVGVPVVVVTNAGVRTESYVDPIAPGWEGLAHALSSVLADEAERERSGTDEGAAIRRLRLLLWQDDPGPAIREAVQIDGFPRPSWSAAPQR